MLFLVILVAFTGVRYGQARDVGTRLHEKESCVDIQETPISASFQSQGSLSSYATRIEGLKERLVDAPGAIGDPLTADIGASSTIKLQYSTNLTSSAPIPELTWIFGSSFPVVNGCAMFPTMAPPSSPLGAPPSYQAHWYAGSVYPGSLPDQNASTIDMSIMVPYSVPRPDEFYYVLLSAWDSAGSYNQIGFSDDYGTWGLTYSWTSGPPTNPTYHYSPNAMTLSLGVTYTFYISTQNGTTHFAAYQDSNQVWSLDKPTGGNYLVLSHVYSTYFDYTDYEEIWYTSTLGGSPAFDFYFFNNYWTSTVGTNNSATWTTFTQGHGWMAPSNVSVLISGNSVLVDNPSGTVLFETNPTGFSSSAGTITFANSTYINDQNDSYVDGDYSATANVPTGYQFDHWECSGSLGVGVYTPDTTDNPTIVHVAGDGWLRAVFAEGITFAQSGLDSTAAGTVVTVNGSAEAYTDLPFTVWADSASTVVYEYGNVTSSADGARFLLTSVEGLSSPITVMNPVTVTGNYKAQYKVTFDKSGIGPGFTGTVVTVDGTDYDANVLPLSLWWDNGSTHSFSFSSPLIVSSEEQYVWTNTTGLSTLQGGSMTVTTSGNVTANYKTQYYLTVTSLHDSPTPPSGWFDSGTSVTSSVTPAPGPTGTQHLCLGWTGTGSVPVSGTDPTVTFTITQASSIVWNWITQYQVTFAQSGLDTTASGTVVTVNSTAQDYSGLPYTLWVNSSDSLVFSYADPVPSNTSGKQFNLASVDSSSPLTVTNPVIITATYNAEYRALVVRGLDNRIYYRSYDFSSGSWNDWNPLPGSTCDSPAAAVYNNELHMIVRGIDGNTLWHGYLDLSTSVFSGWTLLDGATSSAPTLTSNGTVLCLVVRGLDDRIFYRYFTGSWGPWQAVPTGATPDAPAAAMLGSDLHIVVRGMDGSSLWHVTVNDSGVVQDWASISGATDSKPALTANQVAGELYLVVRGLGDGIWLRNYDDSTYSWGSWNQLSGSTVDGAGAAAADNKLYTVVRGSDGSTIWHGYIDLKTSSFSGWTLLDGATPSTPTLIS